MNPAIGGRGVPGRRTGVRHSARRSARGSRFSPTRNELGLLSNLLLRRHVAFAASLRQPGRLLANDEVSRGSRRPARHFPGLHWTFDSAAGAQLTGFEAKRAGTVGEENMRKMGIAWVSVRRTATCSIKPPAPGEHYRLIVAATREDSVPSRTPRLRKVLARDRLHLVLKPEHHQEPNAPAAWRY